MKKELANCRLKLNQHNWAHVHDLWMHKRGGEVHHLSDEGFGLGLELDLLI